MENTVKKVNTVATKKAVKVKAEKKPAEKAVEKKVAEKSANKATPKKSEKVVKPIFDAKAYAAEIIAAFKDNPHVDVKPDTELAKVRDNAQAEYSYIHFFKKGTEKDLFKMYNNSRGSRFAVSRAVYATNEFEAKAKMTKNSKGEPVVSYANISVERDKAVEIAKRLIDVYMMAAE